MEPTSGIVVPNSPRYPALPPVAAAARVHLLSRKLADEFLADLTDFHDPDADCLTDGDFAAMGRELAHYANQLLDAQVCSRCRECAQYLETAMDIATAHCHWCRRAADRDSHSGSRVAEAVTL